MRTHTLFFYTSRSVGMIALFTIMNAHLSLAQVQSSDGFSLDPKSTFRCLNIFVNIIYDIPAYSQYNPEPNSNDPTWPYLQTEGINQNQVAYLPDFFDTQLQNQPQALVSRFFHEASFSEFQVIGEFVIVDIKHSTIKSNGGNFSPSDLISSVVSLINAQGGLDGSALHGNIDFSEYDQENMNGNFDLVNFYLRNAVIVGNNIFGTTSAGSGGKNTGFVSWNYNANLLCNGQPRDFDTYTYQGAGTSDQSTNYKTVVIHEIGHLLFGGNTFHAGGGQHSRGNVVNTFLEFQGGFSVMGAAKSSLVSANAYDRWRLDWRHDSNLDHRIAVSNERSDLTQADGNQTFFLRDATTYGDAIRIQLPYVDEGAFPQYIWLENHQVGNNGKLDFFQYAKAYSCIPDAAGVYAYYQVGKHVVEGTYTEVYPANESDNLKMITPEGFYDIETDPEGQTAVTCYNGTTPRRLYTYREPNPFSGAQDQTEISDWHVQASGGLQITGGHRGQPFVAIKADGSLENVLNALGDSHDAFTGEELSEISMSTNPAAVNTLTYHSRQGKDDDPQISPRPQYNTRHTYLTGLNISISAGGYHNEGQILRVDIRWDDYYVDQNVRWCSDIVLKEELHLVGGRRILLDQGRNPYQKFRDPVSQEYFPTTKFTCEPGSLFEIESGGEVVLRNQSSLIVEDGADFIIRDGGILRVEAGCNLDLIGNVTVEGEGRIIIECGATYCFNQALNLNLQDPQSLVLISELSPLQAGCNIPGAIFSGLGDIHVFSGSTQALTIANQTFSADAVEGGQTIYCHSSTVEAPAKLSLLVEEEVRLGTGFEVETNGELEIIQASCVP